MEEIIKALLIVVILSPLLFTVFIVSSFLKQGLRRLNKYPLFILLVIICLSIALIYSVANGNFSIYIPLGIVALNQHLQMYRNKSKSKRTTKSPI